MPPRHCVMFWGGVIMWAALIIDHRDPFIMSDCGEVTYVSTSCVTVRRVPFFVASPEARRDAGISARKRLQKTT